MILTRSRLPAALAFVAVGSATLLSPRSLEAQGQAGPPPGDRVRTVTDTLVGAVGGLAVDGLGAIYVADFGETVYKVLPDGRWTVFATGLYGTSGNAIDSRGRLLQSQFTGNSIARVSRTGEVDLLATGLQGPVGIAVDSADVMYVCNCRSNTLSRVTPDGEVSLFAESDLFACPNGITRTPDGTLYVVNFSDGRVLEVTPQGQVSELAVLPGGGNGHITQARGQLYATSFRGHRVYRISMDGEVTPVAGTGALGEKDGPAAEATFSWPNGIAANPIGDRLYVNDFINRFPPTVEAPPVPRSTVRQITFASFSSVLAAALRQGGIEALREAYRDWKDDPATAALFTEVEVNAMGYALMGGGNLQAALALFELNAESYPASFNVWDSLAEAHMNAGNRDEAIRFYEKSLELNPANTNAVEKLEELRGGG